MIKQPRIFQFVFKALVGVLGFIGYAYGRRCLNCSRKSSVNGTTWHAITLATVPAKTPPKDFDPYVGDYEHLMSVGKDFYGVFCANNTPNKANFPKGVTYQRNANFTAHTLLDVDNATPVDVSIDPFFFRVTG